MALGYKKLYERMHQQVNGSPSFIRVFLETKKGKVKSWNVLIAIIKPTGFLVCNLSCPIEQYLQLYVIDWSNLPSRNEICTLNRHQMRSNETWRLTILDLVVYFNGPVCFLERVLASGHLKDYHSQRPNIAWEGIILTIQAFWWPFKIKTSSLTCNIRCQCKSLYVHS